MSNRFTFSPATRCGVLPLVGLYGGSNSGKTYSALLMARGFAGPNGKVIMGDTESGRGKLYADMVPGSYLHCDIEPPFSPECYMSFLDAAEADGADAIVIDSFSHEWEGIGGVLDMAAEAEERSGKPGLHCWKKPKLAHAQLIQRLMRSKTFVILCLRAKHKSRQVKNERGKNEIVKDDHVTPIQSDEFIFELTAHAEMQPGNPGAIRLTKWSVPDLAECFPTDLTEKIGIATGEKIALWASDGTAGKPRPQTAPQKSDRESAINTIWQACAAGYAGDKQAFQDDLIHRGLMKDEEKFNKLPLNRLQEIAKALGIPL